MNVLIRNVVRRLLEHDDAISTKLAAFAKEDQQPRNEYVKYLAKYPSWQEASKAWQKEKQVPPDDVFGDRKRQPEYKKFISDHLEAILTNPKATSNAWLIVQHMDNDVEFQEWFLSKLDSASEDFQYLYDRVAVNRGNPQKFNTQRVEVDES